MFTLGAFFIQEPKWFWQVKRIFLKVDDPPVTRHNLFIFHTSWKCSGKQVNRFTAADIFKGLCYITVG